MKHFMVLLVVMSVAMNGCSHLMPAFSGAPNSPAAPARTVEAKKPAAIAAPAVQQQRQTLPSEIDSDGDGVSDNVDECFATPQGVAVDSMGCPVSLYLKTSLMFSSMEAGPTARIQAKIKRIGHVLQQNPAARATIAGHTDDSGDAKTNLVLSRQRAKSIKQLLCTLYEIDPSRIVTQGYGETHPIVSNATEKGRQRNRRVEVTLEGYYRKTTKTSYIALNRPYNIHFGTGESMISGEFKRKVDKLGAYLNDNPEVSAVIDGHTDNIGNAQDNLQLSEQRANAVRSYLQKRYNIAPRRLVVRGHGEKAPIASNDTEEGRFQNRRVTITVKPSASPSPTETYTSRLSNHGRIDTATYAPLDDSVTIRFKAQTIEPDLQAFNRIDQVGMLLQTNPELHVTIEGHAESGKSHANNMRLSQQRAESVKNYLQTRYDISPERLHAIGFGSELPLADASSTESVQIKVKRF